MRQAVFVEPQMVEWRDAPSPTLQADGEALVRPLVVGRCDLDVAYVQGLVPMPSGSPIGHEIIGEVVALGDRVTSCAIGQRVFVPAQISCGTCEMCRRGATGRCASVPFGASYGMGRDGGYGGGLADLIRVPFADAMLSPTPAGATLVDLIGAADMAGDAFRAVVPALADRQNARVCVLGGMPPVIGLYAAALAVIHGAREVDYVDTNARRRAVASAYGASPRDRPTGEYDVIVVANPSPDALKLAFESAAPAASITSVTPTLGDFPRLDTALHYHRGLTWSIGRPDCRHCRDSALAAWAVRGFRPDLVSPLVVDWDDAPHAWSSDALYVVATRE